MKKMKIWIKEHILPSFFAAVFICLLIAALIINTSKGQFIRNDFFALQKKAGYNIYKSSRHNYIILNKQGDDLIVAKWIINNEECDITISLQGDSFFAESPSFEGVYGTGWSKVQVEIPDYPIGAVPPWELWEKDYPQVFGDMNKYNIIVSLHSLATQTPVSKITGFWKYAVLIVIMFSSSIIYYCYPNEVIWLFQSSKYLSYELSYEGELFAKFLSSLGMISSIAILGVSIWGC